MSISLDPVTTSAEANVTLTGLPITANLGNEIINIDVDVAVTGQLATASLQSVTTSANSDVVLGGLSLTMQLNSVVTVEWEVVDVGNSVYIQMKVPETSTVFTEVNTGTSVVWIDIAA
jgi:hypothetical protein